MFPSLPSLSGDQGGYQGEHCVQEGDAISLLRVSVTQRDPQQEVPEAGSAWKTPKVRDRAN